MLLPSFFDAVQHQNQLHLWDEVDGIVGQWIHRNDRIFQSHHGAILHIASPHDLVMIDLSPARQEAIALALREKAVIFLGVSQSEVDLRMHVEVLLPQIGDTNPRWGKVDKTRSRNVPKNVSNKNPTVLGRLFVLTWSKCMELVPQ